MNSGVSFRPVAISHFVKLLNIPPSIIIAIIEKSNCFGDNSNSRHEVADHVKSKSGVNEFQTFFGINIRTKAVCRELHGLMG